jgi:cbb3-type cytochrome oxidase subunit 1
VPRIDSLFLRIAVLYAVAGMALGIFMAASQDHSQMPTHAHINLLGWVSMALYAVVYRLWSEAGGSALARWHFWLANLGMLVLTIGVGGIMAGKGEDFEFVATIGALLSLAAMLLFAVIVWRSAAAERRPEEHNRAIERSPRRAS